MTPLADLDLPVIDIAGVVGDDLHDVLAEARATSWLVRNRAGVCVLDREGAELVLRSPRLDFPGVALLELLGVTEGAIHRTMARGLLGRNGEDHRRLRRLVSRAFTPAAAARWRPVMVEELRRLVEGFGDAGSFDGVVDLARPFPSRMIARIVGAPAADAPRLREWSAIIQARLDVTALTARRDEIEAGTAAFEAYVEALVEEHRARPSDGMATELLAVEVNGERLDHDDVVSLLIAVLSGAIDTTENQLAHGLRMFAEHPDQWALLAADPSLARRAAEEVVRLEPVAPFTARIVREELTYRDVVFPVGTVVFACAWTANGEAPGAERPDVLSLTAPRGTGHALSFGAGAHLCLGIHLAWAELEEALAFLAARLPDLRPAGPVVYGNPLGIYDVKALPLKYGHLPI